MPKYHRSLSQKNYLPTPSSLLLAPVLLAQELNRHQSSCGKRRGRFRRQIFRKLTIDLWVRQKGVPKNLVPWNEGQTEVDVVIKWENPPTTVFVEMKYGSQLSRNTADSKEQSQYPTDQLIRNVRIGLWKNDWYADQRLFSCEPRDFYTILCSPKNGNVFVEQYQSNENIRSAIPNSERFVELPDQPFVGEEDH